MCGHSQEQRSHIARSDNPHVRAGSLAKLSPEQIVAEVVDGVWGSGAPEGAIVVSKRNKKGLAIVESADPVADAAAAAELLGRSVFDLENDPTLQAEGAVTDEKGMLLRGYYRKFREAFKDKERSCVELTTGTVNRRPGMRAGEEWPDGLRIWDDTRKGKLKRKFKVKGKAKMQTQEWGAGWIAEHPWAQKKGLGSAWMNVKKWSTWRLVFVLARLQRAVWVAKGLADGLEMPVPAVPSDKPPKSVFRGKGIGLKRKRATTGTATPLKRRRKGERGSEQKVLAICDAAKDGAQPTLLNFFAPEAKQKVEAPAKQTLMSFFKSSKPKVDAAAEGASSSSS